MTSGNITTQERFNKIKTHNEGVILITDYATGNYIHLINCSHVTEQDFLQKVVTDQSRNSSYYWYENIPHALTEHPDFLPCIYCKPDIFEKKTALNESGTFLQISVINQLNIHGWSPQPEFPVSLAPFIKDPMKYPGISATTPGIVRPSMFQQAVSESQNQFLKKETSLDALCGRTENNIHYIPCIQVKKLNPKYVDWCFFKEDNLRNELRVVTKSLVGRGLVDLLTIPQTDRGDPAIHIQIERFDIPSFPVICSDYGVALHKDPNQ
ncbi:MAG: hypothetical protein WD650_03335, partial [Nitrosopumilaceae archaeon]